MKRILCVLLLAFMVSCPSFAVVLEQMKTSTIPEKISSSTPLFVTLGGTSSGTFDLTLPSVYLATTSYTVLATNAVTLFQNVASFTSGDLVIFQGRSKFYWSVSSNPTKTAAEMQLQSYVAESGDTPVQVHLDTTTNLAFVADSASTATLTYSIVRER